MSIEGKNIVFTGRISIPRHEAQQLVNEHGGICGSSVSRNTDYLVVGEEPGTKLIKAKSLGIPTISEAEFHKLLGLTGELTGPTSIQEVSRETGIFVVIEEKPLTPEALFVILNSLTTYRCRFCNRQFQHWRDYPPYDTCSVCSALANPACLHCDSEPLFVQDFDLYHCTLCTIWFRAPYSPTVRQVKHHHMFQNHTSCPCGATIPTKPHYELVRLDNYNLAPQLVQEWHRRDEQLRQHRNTYQTMNNYLSTLSAEQIESLYQQYSKTGGIEESRQIGFGSPMKGG